LELLQFLATAKPKRESWLQTMTDEEKTIMAQHFAYANQLFSEGKIVFDGACLDGAMGIIVYQAESQEAAFELHSNDPLVKSGIVNTELHPFRVGHILHV
jgi:uncharacterized protein YciI